MPIDFSQGSLTIMVYVHHYAIGRMYLWSTKWGMSNLHEV